MYVCKFKVDVGIYHCQKYNLKSLLNIIYAKFLVSYTVAGPWTSREVKNISLFQKIIP